jgi:hypothetical protein
VYVLAIDTDDAEDQAEALTTALRSRVRSAPGWSLSETTVTLSMLTAALKCARTPDAPCLAKIAEQLKADRFIWGQLQKVPGNRVKVEAHLWSRNKPEQHASETYADNLKDFTDDRLLRIAQRLFDRLAGTVSTGALLVHAGDANGVVFVDGQRQATLTNGDATLDLLAGSHTVEVRAQGYAPSSDTITVTAGKETRLNVNLVATDGGQKAASGSPGGRRVAGWAAVGIGSALLIGASVGAILYVNAKKDGEEYSNHILLLGERAPNAKTGARSEWWTGDPCEATVPAGGENYANTACDYQTKAVRASAFAWISGGVGAAAVLIGVYLLATDSGPEKGPPKFEDRAKMKLKPQLRLVPEVSAKSRGIGLVGSF